MLQKKIFLPELIDETFSIFFGNIQQIAAVVLIIWFPANLLILLLNSGFHVRVAASIFSPLAGASVTYIALCHKTGEKCTALDAICKALNMYWPIIEASLISGLKIAAGMLLLVPGFYWMMKYALIIPIVVTEGDRAGIPREKSYGMTHGRVSLVFFCFLAFIAAPFLLNIFVGVLIKYVGFELSVWSAALIFTFFDLLMSTFSIAMFLIYIHLVNLKLARIQSEMAFADNSSVSY